MTENELISRQIWNANYSYRGDSPEDPYTGSVNPYDDSKRPDRRSAMEALFG